MRVKVARERCIGCGLCEAVCRNVFEVWHGTAVVRVDTVPAVAEGLCLKAASNCPEGAIRVRELAGGMFPRWTSCGPVRGAALGYPGIIWCEPISAGRGGARRSLRRLAPATATRQGGIWPAAEEKERPR